jgi:hypothetical protein
MNKRTKAVILIGLAIAGLSAGLLLGSAVRKLTELRNINDPNIPDVSYPIPSDGGMSDAQS